MLTAHRDPTLGCVQTQIQNDLLAASFIGIIVLDFLGLAFCMSKVTRLLRLRTQLSIFLFKDGMIYFLTVYDL